jgi:hypothetical protein
VDAITAVQWQQARRRHALGAAGNTGHLLPEEKSPVDWGNLQGQLLAFAAPAVLIALKAANDAGLRASGFCLELADVIRKAIESRDQDGDYPPWYEPEIDSTPHIRHVQEAARQAVQAANDKDDALIEAIRVDLHGEHGKVVDVLSPPSAPASARPDAGQ